MIASLLQLELTETAQVGHKQWANNLNCKRDQSHITSNSVGATESIPKEQKEVCLYTLLLAPKSILWAWTWKYWFVCSCSYALLNLSLIHVFATVLKAVCTYIVCNLSISCFNSLPLLPTPIELYIYHVAIELLFCYQLWSIFVHCKWVVLACGTGWVMSEIAPLYYYPQQAHGSLKAKEWVHWHE